MPSIFMSFLLAALLLVDTTFSLQVSSNSPCTALCLDVGQNATDTTNTSGSDITCQDADYTKTAAGQKFISCVSCLQTSTASDENGSDQEWFLYNLRFALDSCLFGFQQPVDFVPNPCSTSEFCQPLQLSMEDGSHVITNETEYSYCSANEYAITGAYLNSCRDCLIESTDEKFLRNFLTALQAGCVQQPGTGTIIGLEGNVFSDIPVNITFPGDHQAAPAPKASKGGLPQSAIIGMAVGLSILLLLAIALVIICIRRRKSLNRLRQLKLESSPLDSRFGAGNITAPTNGSYGNARSYPPVSVNEPFDTAKFKMSQLTGLDTTQNGLEKHTSPKEMTASPGGWLDGAHARLAAQRNTQTPASLPTHHAYNPSITSPISPAPSDATSDDTYQMKEYPSSRSSPKNVPPPLIKEPKPPLHRKSLSAQGQPLKQMRAINPPEVYASSPPKIEFRPDSQATLRYEPRNRSVSRTRGDSRTRNESRTRDDSRTRADSRTQSRTQSRAESRAQSREQSRTRNDSRTRILDSRPRGESRTRDDSRNRDESSRVSPPGLHSQRMASIADEPHPSRSGSRGDNYKRATVRPGLDNTNASGDTPIAMPAHLDFELAETERKAKEIIDGLTKITKDSFKKKKARPEDETPVSAESEEQWPGSY